MADRSTSGPDGKKTGSLKLPDVALLVVFVLAMLAQAPTLATAVLFAAPVVVVVRAVWPVARHVPAGYRWLTKW